MALRIAPTMDDFDTRPWDYPGVAADRTGILRGAEYHPVGADAISDVLAQEDQAPVDDRHLVVAVGSNASPAVVHRKFARAGVSCVVPFVRAEMRGLAVGHCAQVSRRGYLAAAPFLAPGHRAEVVATWLDDEQLAALDATEPGYVRGRMNAPHHELELDGGERPEAFWVYDSSEGLIAPPGAGAVPFTAQAEIFGLLRSEVTGMRAALGGGSVEQVSVRLAGSEELRDQVRRSLAERGWAADSGLVSAPGGSSA